MGQISGQASESRVPEKTSDNVDLNVCVNPTCQNFNISPSQSRKDPHYKLTDSRKESCIQCVSCKRFYLIKSNRAVSEEIDRLRYKRVLSKVYRQDGTACHNISCSQFGLYAETPSIHYRRRGVTQAGHPRFQCKACGKTFTRGSEKRKSHPLTKSYENDHLFRLLVNQTSINRALELSGLSPLSIYKKVDMFYERSVAFMNKRETRLKDLPIKHLRLSSDRQEYGVNWTNREDKRNVVLSAIGTADSYSSYVFGMEINFDPDVNLQQLTSSQQYRADQRLKEFNRACARIWTQSEQDKVKKAKSELSLQRQELLKSEFAARNLMLNDESVAALMDEIEQESSDATVSFNDAATLPENGALVRGKYTMCAHFRLLQELIGHADKLTFYLDQDPLINRAVLNAFAEQVEAGVCRAGYVRIGKGLTVDQRKYKVIISQKAVKTVMDRDGLDKEGAERQLIRDSLADPYEMNGSREVWFNNPINRIYECDKYVAVLTDAERLSEGKLVEFIYRASLHPIDNFFQMVRRRPSLLERPMHSQSNNGRVWTGKSAYNPAMVDKMLQILRVYYNFCLVGKDKKTPAERLGLARGPVEIRKILYP